MYLPAKALHLCYTADLASVSFLKSVKSVTLSFLFFSVTILLAQHILKTTISKAGNQPENASCQEWLNLQSQAEVILTQ